MKYILLWFITGCWSASIAYADVGSDLQHFFDGMGTNVTATRVYRSQQAGYYTGGSIVARSGVRQLEPVHVDLPRFRSGCGGIDLFAGGFSFVDSQQLVEVMRNILNNAKGYAFTLAMETVTPQIANAMKYLQDMANKVNQSNIQSCEMAEELVGGLWPKTRAAQQQVCQDIGANTGIFADWAEARQGCRSEQMASTLAAGEKDSRYQGSVFTQGNVAWKILQQNPGLAQDQTLAELLMALSGTVILEENGKGLVTLPSLVSEASLLQALLEGGAAPIYRCEESLRCLHPKRTTVQIVPAESLRGRIKSLLTEMQEHLLTDAPLSESAKNLLTATRLPLYKMINVQAAYQQDAGLFDIDSDADLLAVDLLFQYLENNLTFLQAASTVLPYPPALLETFRSGVLQAMKEVRNKARSLPLQISAVRSRIEQTQLLEQMLAGGLSTDLTNQLEWAQGLH